MKYFVQLIFIAICLSSKSSILYAQTESLIRSHVLTEDGLSLDHESETEGILDITVTNPDVDQELLYIDVYTTTNDRQRGPNYLNPVQEVLLKQNKNGQVTSESLFFNLDGSQLYLTKDENG